MSRNDRLAAMAATLIHQQKRGKRALNKLLFISDVVHEMRHGAPISKAQYYKLLFGPTPEWLGGSMRHLQKTNRVIMKEETLRSGWMRDTYYPGPELNAEYAANILPETAIQVLQEVGRAFAHKHTRYISKNTTLSLAWQQAELEERLDMSHIRDDEPLLQWLAKEGLLNHP